MVSLSSSTVRKAPFDSTRPSDSWSGDGGKGIPSFNDDERSDFGLASFELTSKTLTACFTASSTIFCSSRGVGMPVIIPPFDESGEGHISALDAFFFWFLFLFLFFGILTNAIYRSTGNLKIFMAILAQWPVAKGICYFLTLGFGQCQGTSVGSVSVPTNHIRIRIQIQRDKHSECRVFFYRIDRKQS